jgi:hypothetical protein
MEILIILFFIFLIASGKSDENIDNDNLDRYKDYYKEKEEEFYHPVTGYKGTKSEMDAYIINREKKINEKN